jgi:hypothetical protein
VERNRAQQGQMSRVAPSESGMSAANLDSYQNSATRKGELKSGRRSRSGLDHEDSGDESET